MPADPARPREPAAAPAIDALSLDVHAASQDAAEELVCAGMRLVSVYLEDGDVLRCYALRGYRQFFDGIRPGVGVIGEVWRSGQPVELARAGDHPGYRGAASRVLSELCVPIRLGGRTVGAVNVESTGPLSRDDGAAVRRAAERLSGRLADAGGLPGSSPAQRLLGFATALAEADGPASVADALLSAAAVLSGHSSAVLLLGRPPRAFAATGPLAAVLSGLPGQVLETVDGWVLGGGSSRSAQDPSGQLLAGQEELARAGVLGVLAVSVGVGRERLGSLVLADREDMPVAPAAAESVELLAALGAASLRSARAGQALRRRAETDPLTGLAHRSGFETALRDAVACGAPPGQRAAVLALDLDGFKDVNDTKGHAAGDDLLRAVAQAMAGSLRDGDRLFRLGGDEFATVLIVRDDREAMNVAQGMREACSANGTGTVSVGVAMVRPSDTPAEVLERADRALYATKRAGRDGVTLRR